MASSKATSTRRSSASPARRAIARADALLPGRPAADGESDPRWQAILRVAEYVESDPEAIWSFVRRWGTHAQADLRMAIATCLLEHLLEHHFDLIFPRVESAALRGVRFASTFESCWSFGQATEPTRAARMRDLQDRLKLAAARRRRRGASRPRRKASGGRRRDSTHVEP